MIAHLGTLYNLDLDRLFLSGHSGGAFFVQGHGLSNASTYVAAVTISGGCIASSEQYGNSCSVYKQLSNSAQRKIPFFVVHHASDQVVPQSYSAELIKVLNANGHPTSAISDYSPGSSGHSIDPAIVPQIWTWISGNSLP
jgi:predicted esterase